ncbi:GGDEF domain-containing protein [Candidatus Saccharibacteria bacterium]|nr:GGDEF domain-containing protein [Candidatus Saccharibacteria bacterium]MBQ9016991.1 GGDEF domain-containing protein [Candidatus Saccharibacteria bacterium]
MKEKFKNLLLLSEIDDKDYTEDIISHMNKDNRTMVNTISLLLAILAAAMFVSALFISGVHMNQVVYIGGTLASFLLFLTSVHFSERCDFLTMPLVYLSYSIFYVYGILIGTVTDPGQKTVTFMVMLVFLPVLFVDRPIHTIIMTFSYVAIFIALCFKNKTGAVLWNDIIDAVIFGILGIVSGTIVNHVKVRGYVLEAQLKKVGRTDQLTGMNNRNAYELDLYTIPKKCQHTLSCIYIDANGLKQINDTKGHKSGDKLLKCIAENIIDTFGDELSYRLGGDEFIIFIPDCDNVNEKVRTMSIGIIDNGYQISVGWDSHRTDHLSMTTLIHNAESRMYKKKAEFYRNARNDRRREET